MERIYIIRGQKVILDRDLAKLYEVDTKVLKQAVKRNIDRFPQDFMFEMTKGELENWRSQFVTSNSSEPLRSQFASLNNDSLRSQIVTLKADKMGLRHLPFCFTEQGVAMLSSVLNSERAIKVNIQIIRIFTTLRQILYDNTELRLEIEQLKKKLHNQNQNIKIVFRYLDELIEKSETKTERTKIGYRN